MRLYLGSKHVQFPRELAKLVSSKNGHIVSGRLIVNGFDNYPEMRRNKHIKELKQSLTATGFLFKLLDLRDYIDKSMELALELKECDILWISGGNVFYLRYLLWQSGLDRNLAVLLHEDLVYGGDSAGAAVLGFDLHGLDLLDDPAEAPKQIFDGLGITPFIILPHWGNERYADEISNTKTILEKNNDEVVTISDAQACIVNGDSRKIIG